MAIRTPNNFNLFVILVLIVTMQFKAESKQCSLIKNYCDVVDCPSLCKSEFKDGTSSCSFFNLCTCFFEGAVDQNCNIAMGFCNAECNALCCNQKCQQKYGRDSVGICNESKGVRLCICYY
ncbi:defensin-like protein 181 [Vicia villosa]|uniref:defensin-like protein 181 n=1 Tax=Vicia villosa TaxID=3911 RepID=UPI00273BFD84|nr:defensin-like protein 181 [Vicia villosa]